MEPEAPAEMTATDWVGTVNEVSRAVTMFAPALGVAAKAGSVAIVLSSLS